MKTHIFIGSTFYDLTYKQEDLSNFVKVHDFEPIMFEDGGLAYAPGKRPDKSRYEAMKLADMVILIIGGSHGSPIAGVEENGYMTGKEFKNAIEEGVPVYAFIDRQVYAEYGVYDLNAEQIDQDSNFIKFKATKDVNVFRFINEIQDIGNISITEFSRLEEIKDYLSGEWSEMFRNHLKSLRAEKPVSELDPTLSKFSTLITEMRTTLSSTENRILEAKNQMEIAENETLERMRAETNAACGTISDLIVVRKNDLSKEMNVEALVDSLQEYYGKNEDRIEADYLINGVPEDVLEEDFLIPLFSKGISVDQANDRLFVDLQLKTLFRTEGMDAKIKSILNTDEIMYQKIFEQVK